MGNRERSRGLFDRRPICGACLGACEVQAITSTHCCCHDSRNFCTCTAVVAQQLGKQQRILENLLYEFFLARNSRNSSRPLFFLFKLEGPQSSKKHLSIARTFASLLSTAIHFSNHYLTLRHKPFWSALTTPTIVSFRFVSFRFVLFDAGRPLLRGTSFWGFRTTAVTLQFNGGRAFVRP